MNADWAQTQTRTGRRGELGSLRRCSGQAWGTSSLRVGVKGGRSKGEEAGTVNQQRICSSAGVDDGRLRIALNLLVVYDSP